MKLDNVEILLSDARGIYIPRDFVQGFDLSKWSGISESDIEILQNPENEWYWDAWESVLNNALVLACFLSLCIHIHRLYLCNQL